MVLRREGDAVLAIGQPSHAWISGQLARAWGNYRFGSLEPREEVCLAAEQHDAGMAAWDARPTLNPETGLPRSFMEMQLPVHVELWSRAWELVAAQSRYAALLVSMHGTAVHGMRDLDRLGESDRELVRDYMAGQRAVQERLAAGLDRELVARNQRLLWTWDALSLALCLDWAPHSLRGVPAAGGETVDVELAPAGERRASVSPWPFAREVVRVRCDARRLEGRFGDEEAMRAAFREAPWVALEFELAPGAGSDASA